MGGDSNRERERGTQAGYQGDRWAHGQEQTSRERGADVCVKTRERVPVREQKRDTKPTETPGERNADTAFPI